MNPERRVQDLKAKSNQLTDDVVFLKNNEAVKALQTICTEINHAVEISEALVEEFGLTEKEFELMQKGVFKTGYETLMILKWDGNKTHILKNPVSCFVSNHEDLDEETQIRMNSIIQSGIFWDASPYTLRSLGITIQDIGEISLFAKRPRI